MSEAPDKQRGGGPAVPAEAVGDALRTAVERTLAVTAEGASETRQRAQGLLDDVVRRGQVARDEVTRRGEGATARLAEAINELRTADDESIRELSTRLGAIERRVAALEAASGPPPNPLVEVDESSADPHDQRDSEA